MYVINLIAVSTGVNTKEESIPQQSSAVQVKPDIASVGIQNTSIETKAVAIQTEKPQKKCCLETNCIVKIPPVTPNLQQSKKLSIQHMPPINIKRKLVVQNVLKFYIDNQSKSHYIPQSKAKNARYYEISNMNYHTNYQNLKIKFEKDLEERIKSTSSELSSILHNKPRSKQYNMKLMNSVSDGELIKMRKKQLKVKNQPKVQGNTRISLVNVI